KTEKKKNLKPYVEVKDLVTQFFTSRGIVKALDKVSFAVYPGEIYGLVGESGCGKSVTSTSVMDLIPDPPGRIISGEIYIDGFNVIADLNKMARIKIKSETDVRIKRYKRAIKRHNNVLSKIRGDKIAMIFQEPFLALNPTMTIGAQIMEVIMLHNISSISNSILRRENISPGEVRNFITEFYSLGDETLKRKEAHNFSSSYAIPEFEESILSL
ncbi:oligopeptide/dipeptide ABC transporter, ATPase subunit, partial [mine drainage metagenome]